MANTNNLETLSLIWLDAGLNDDEDSLAAQKDFRQLFHQFRPFTQENECEALIEQTTEHDRIALIVSGSMGLTLIPKIHRLRQIFAIYIYCMNKKKYEDWSQPYPKVIGIHTAFEDLIVQIRNDLKKRSENKIDEPLLITRTDTMMTKVNVDFLYFRLLIESLLQSKSNVEEKSQCVRFLEKLYKDNSNELKVIKEFDQTYQSHRAIWWWTRETFLIRLVNRAIRNENLDVLLLFRFYLRDLKNQIEQNRCSAPVRVYRSQILSTDELDRLKSSIGSFISISNYFIGNADRNVSTDFLSNYSFKNAEEKVLFEIDAKATKTFANLHSSSYQMNGNEFLFSAGSIFRLKTIEKSQMNLSIVRLSLVDEEVDEEFRRFDEKLRSHFHIDVDRSKKFALGNLFYQTKKFDFAEKFYHQIINDSSTVDQSDRIECFHALGIIALAKDDLSNAVRWNEQSLKTFENDDPRIAETYHCLASIHQKRGDFPVALEFYQKATQIWSKTFGDDHFQMADSLSNIGCIYEYEGNYSNAFEYHQKALRIREKKRSNDQSELGASYNNIGNVYLSMNDFDQALKFYQTALEMKTTSLPSEHISIGTTLANLGFVLEKKRIFDQALNSYQRAMTIFRSNFPSNHCHIQRIDEDIRRSAQLLRSIHHQTMV